MNERIKNLRDAVEAAHKCRTLQHQSIPVHGMFGDKGEVEKSSFMKHLKAKSSYAWSFKDGSTTRYITVLELPPVDSPQTAVRAAIASKVQK